MEIIKAYLTNNECFKVARKLVNVKGIVKHSTGVNNTNLLRYIGTNSTLGVNNGMHWNKPGVYKCVHFMIGKNAKGEVKCYQTLPLEYQCWGCGSGSKGSYNQTHIQYEILEDDLKDKEYFIAAFALARELDAYLCKLFKLKASSIVSHYEAYKLGYASAHHDCDNWLSVFGRTMDNERAAVAKLLNPPKPTNGTPDVPTSNTGAFKVKIIVSDLNVRKGPGMLYKATSTVKKGEVYTIVATQGSWGRLKSGAGWINIGTQYVKRQ